MEVQPISNTQPAFGMSLRVRDNAIKFISDRGLSDEFIKALPNIIDEAKDVNMVVKHSVRGLEFRATSIDKFEPLPINPKTNRPAPPSFRQYDVYDADYNAAVCKSKPTAADFSLAAKKSKDMLAELTRFFAPKSENKNVVTTFEELKNAIKNELENRK